MGEPIDGVEVTRLKRREDARGWLLKVLMRDQLADGREFGEIYVCRSEAGVVRAHHYHEDTTEWFCVLRGRGDLRLESLVSGATMTVRMDADAPCVVSVPPRVAHAVECDVESELYLLAYADRPYDESAPDTIPHRVAGSSRGA